MPGQRYQDPKIQTRADVGRPFYFIRPYVPSFTSTGLERKQKSIPLGFCDEISVREAKARKQQIMATVNAGKFVIQSQIPFAEIVQKFLDARVPQLGAATQDKYRTHIENHIRPVFGSLRLCDIDRPAVEAWLNEKAKSHTVTPKNGETVERAGLGWWARQDLRNILSAVFAYAAECKLWQGENPCSGIDMGPKRFKRQKRIPKSEDLARFLAILPETAICSAEAARLMVLTAIVAGLRVSEVLALKPETVDAEGRALEVRRRWHRGDEDEPKSENSRRRRQIGGLASELLRFARGKVPDDFIFARKDGNPPDDRDLQQHVFRPAAEATGIYHEGFGMHVFRRLNITWRQEAGATPFEAQKAAGHAKPDTTWLYTITDEERERAHVEQIWNRITGQAVGAIQ
jgi:integrase